MFFFWCFGKHAYVLTNVFVVTDKCVLLSFCMCLLPANSICLHCLMTPLGDTSPVFVFVFQFRKTPEDTLLQGGDGQPSSSRSHVLVAHVAGSTPRRPAEAFSTGDRMSE